MKITSTFVALAMWSISVFASDTAIVFRQIEYADLFEIAKQENKAVMIYFHFDGCGACVQMEKTAFKDDKVYEYYNSNFINFEVHTRKGNGIEINEIYNIQMNPTFMFLDNSGNELHRIVGFFSPDEFLAHAQNVLNTNKTLTYYKKLYQEGNRNADFLYDYTGMLKDAYEIDSMVVNEYLNAVDPKDLKLERNIRFIYEFCIYHFKLLIPFTNPHFETLLENKDEFCKYFDKDQVDTRIVWILSTATYQAADAKDEATFKKALKILEEYDTGEQYLFKEMDGRLTGMMISKNLVLTSLLYYYEQMDDKTNYNKTLATYLSKIWNDADELNNFAWGIFEEAAAEDTDRINTAIRCSVRSVELNNNYANNDTYAWLLYKSGDQKKALKQARKTIRIARRDHEDYIETQELVEILEDEKY